MRGLHDEYAPALWSFALHLTGGDRAQAEDVVQETLLRAWKQSNILSQQDVSPRSWLFTVARNIVVDQWRANQRRPAELRGHVWDAEFPGPNVPDYTDNAVQSLVVTDALKRLSAEHQAVLLECYFRGSTAQQAAVRLGIPVGTVKSRLHYALHALRLVLQEMGVVR